MPPRNRAAVDPRFPAELRRLRTARGLSLRTLAGLVYQGKSLVHELETGQAPPTVDLAERLDAALEAGGSLARLVQSGPEVPEGDADRLDYVARCPRRADLATVNAVEVLLAGQRRLEDSVGSAAVLPPVRSELELVTDLVAEARDPVRARLVDVAAQWAQFSGWLHIASADHAAARAWLGQALEWATEASNRDMIGTVLSFRGYLAEEQGQRGPAIGLTRVSLRDPCVFVGQRAYDQYQLARGLARVGDRAGALDALAAGNDLALESAEYRGHMLPWHYYRSPAYFAIERGVVHHLLGQQQPDHSAQAVELLTSGLSGLSADAQGAEWAGMYWCRRACAARGSSGGRRGARPGPDRRSRDTLCSAGCLRVRHRPPAGLVRGHVADARELSSHRALTGRYGWVWRSAVPVARPPRPP